MNISIIYESKYGNGKQAMMYLENILRKKGCSVQLMSVHEVKPHLLPESDLYIFSAPNAFGKIVRSMRKFLEKIEIKTQMLIIFSLIPVLILLLVKITVLNRWKKFSEKRILQSYLRD